MTTSLPDVLGAIATEGVGFLKTAGVTAGRAALAAYLNKRAADARDILFDELQSGGILPEHVAALDDGIAIMHGFMRAAWEGKARINIRLLARAIKGQLETGALVADEFFLYSDALANLSRDEIILLATLLHSHAQPAEKGVWQACMRRLKAKGWSDNKISAVAGRSLRSGFVSAASGWGTLAFLPSPLLFDVCKTVDFEDVMRREP